MELIKNICDRCEKEYAGCFWDIEDLCEECKARRQLLEKKAWQL